MKTTLHPTCPNCYPNSIYCPECGEKRFEPTSHSFKSFFGSIFSELTDLDSKLFRTLILLSFRPGFLSVEYSRGVSTPYIKPLRLFLVIAVVHFLAFGLSGRGDIYSVDNGILAKAGLTDWLMSSAPLHDHFRTDYSIDQVNQSVKDSLSILIYLPVIVIAGFYKFLFRKQNKYYSEHLVFFLHILAAAFLRNVVFLPLIILHQPTGIAAIGLINLVYVVFAIQRFYGVSLIRTVLTIIPTLLLLMVSITVLWSISLAVALWK